MINPNTYYTVQGWMITELGLRGNELTAYAIIYGFSQDGHCEFSGSLSYLMEWLGCSRPTAIKTLQSLVEKGLVRKKVYGDGINANAYMALRGTASSPQPKPEKQATKHKYGEYRNVLLTDDELEKLRQKFPQDLGDRIERLSEYMASTGKSYKNHYATIMSWSRRGSNVGGQNQAPAGRRAAGPIGPNGIVIDPTKNDLDGQF